MKKILIVLMTVLFSSSTAIAWEKAAGISVSLAGIDSTVTDDIDNDGGTPDTTKEISNNVGIPSIFFEGSNTFGNNGVITVGIDYIPMSAEFESRSTTQKSSKAKAAGASPQTSGTNKGTVDVSGHMTFYIQPGVMINDDTSVFATVGIVRADADIDVQSISSTNKTVEDSLDGTKLGAGIKKGLGGNFIKLEYSKTDYDPISVVTSNNTKVTGDIDNTAVTFSVGRSF